MLRFANGIETCMARWSETDSFGQDAANAQYEDTTSPMSETEHVVSHMHSMQLQAATRHLNRGGLFIGNNPFKMLVPQTILREASVITPHDPR